MIFFYILARGASLFCTCLILAVKHSSGFLDFRPFNTNKQTTPSLNIIPEPEGNFFHFRYGDEKQTQPYIDALTRFLTPYLTPYEKANRGENATACNFNNTPTADSVCFFNKNDLERCASADFGYHRGSPCILFTLSQACFILECP